MRSSYKRIADYVPEVQRAALKKLSKSDLMEIAWDYAVRSVGEDAGPAEAFDEIMAYHRTLKQSRVAITEGEALL